MTWYKRLQGNRQMFELQFENKTRKRQTGVVSISPVAVGDKKDYRTFEIS